MQIKRLLLILIVPIFLFASYAVNSYLTFNGSSSHSTNSSVEFRPSDSSGSIVMWVKPNGYNWLGCVFSVAQNTGSVRYLYFGVHNSHYIYIQQRNNDTDCRVNATTTEVLTDDVFLIAVTSDGTSWALNVNGINQSLSIAAGTNNGDWFSDTGSKENLAFGRKSDSSPSNYFNGAIYQAAVYTSTLSAADLLAIYNAGVSSEMPSSNRVAYWKINENTDTLIDSDGGVNLSVTDGVWTTVNPSVPKGYGGYGGYGGYK